MSFSSHRGGSLLVLIHFFGSIFFFWWWLAVRLSWNKCLSLRIASWKLLLWILAQRVPYWVTSDAWIQIWTFFKLFKWLIVLWGSRYIFGLKKIGCWFLVQCQVMCMPIGKTGGLSLAWHFRTWPDRERHICFCAARYGFHHHITSSGWEFSACCVVAQNPQVWGDVPEGCWWSGWMSGQRVAWGTTVPSLGHCLRDSPKDEQPQLSPSGTSGSRQWVAGLASSSRNPEPLWACWTSHEFGIPCRWLCPFSPREADSTTCGRLPSKGNICKGTKGCGGACWRSVPHRAVVWNSFNCCFFTASCFNFYMVPLPTTFFVNFSAK